MKKQIAMLMTSSILVMNMATPVLADTFTKKLPDNTWVHVNGSQSMDIKEQTATDPINWSYEKDGNSAVAIPYEASTIDGNFNDDLLTIGTELKTIKGQSINGAKLLGLTSTLGKLDKNLFPSAVDKTNIGYVSGEIATIANGKINGSPSLTPSKDGGSVWKSYGNVDFEFAGQKATVNFDEDLKTIGGNIKALWEEYQKQVNVVDRLSEKLTVAEYKNGTVKIGPAKCIDYNDITEACKQNKAEACEQNKAEACEQNKAEASVLTGDLKSTGTGDLVFGNKKAHAEFTPDMTKIDKSIQGIYNGYTEVLQAGDELSKHMVDYEYESSGNILKISVNGNNSIASPGKLVINGDTANLERLTVTQ